jgi:hypothetical protein
MKKRKSNVTYVRKGFAQDPEGKKPFKFEVCDYSCVENSNLKRSMTSVHEGKKQFKCEVCDYSCAENSNMKRYMTLVHEEKNIKCDICDKRFCSSS